MSLHQCLVRVKLHVTLLMCCLPHSVAGITGAVLVTDKAIETWGTESLLAIRPLKPRFTQAGSIDMVTLGPVLTLTPLVTLWTKGAHRTVILTPGENDVIAHWC